MENWVIIKLPNVKDSDIMILSEKSACFHDFSMLMYKYSILITILVWKCKHTRKSIDTYPYMQPASTSRLFSCGQPWVGIPPTNRPRVLYNLYYELFCSHFEPLNQSIIEHFEFSLSYFGIIPVLKVVLNTSI